MSCTGHLPPEPERAATALYADVAVLKSPSRGSRVYSYAAPSRWRDQIAAGQIVLVEFGKRELLGVVLGLAPVSPISKVKPVLAVLSPVPLIGPMQAQLAIWCADNFAVPIGEVLEAMLPPGWRKGVRHQYSVGKAAAGPPTAHRRRVLDAVTGLRLATAEEISAQLGRAVAEKTLTAMVAGGSLSRWSQLDLPEVGTPVVGLAVPPAEALARMEELARAPAQRRLLLKVIAAGGPIAVGGLLKSAKTLRPSLNRLAEAGIVELHRRFDLPPLGHDDGEDMEDLAAQNSLESFLDRPGFGSMLLQGRMRERLPAYVRAINQALLSDRQVLLLAPSIAEARLLAGELRDKLAGRTFLFSDAATPSARIGLWRALRAGEIDVLIGHPPAAWAPLYNLGLVIIDREEDRLYKALPLRSVSAADFARELARRADCPLLVGTATPLVSTFDQVERELVQFLLLRSARLLRQLRMKVGRGWGTAAGSGVAQIVDMGRAQLMGPGGMISEELFDHLAAAFDSGQQAVVHVATRGSATASACRECSFKATCRYCSSNLFWHEDRNALVCHICGQQSPPLESCPECGSLALRMYGYGTQSVVRALRTLLPRARIDRIDSDLKAEVCERNAQRFGKRIINILVGTTRMLAFAQHLRADLLGVIQADFGLNFPDYQAPERVYQVLSRLREVVLTDNIEGTMLLQARGGDNHVLEAVRSGSYLKFFRSEIELRRRYQMPPFRQLTRFVISNRESSVAARQAEQLHQQLDDAFRQAEYGSEPAPQIWGPAQCPVWRQRSIFRWHIIVLSGPGQLLPVFGIPHRGWLVDVDPVEFF